MKRRTLEVTTTTINDLPDEMIREIIAAVIDMDTESPFRVRYQQLNRICRHWVRLIGITEETGNLLKVHFDRYPVCHSLNFENFFTLTDCPCGYLCRHGFGVVVRYRLVDIVWSLCAAIGIKPESLAPNDMFNVWRAHVRVPWICDRLDSGTGFRCAGSPTKNTQLGHIYTPVVVKSSDDDDDDSVIWLPLWALRDKLREGSRGNTRVYMNTKYQMITLNGKRLVPADYRRSREIVHLPCKRNRSFNSLSVEDRAVFLVDHGEEIERNLMDPLKLCRLEGMTPKAFEECLDVLMPLLEQDQRLMHALLVDLRGKMTPGERQVVSLKRPGKQCIHCPKFCCTGSEK